MPAIVTSKFRIANAQQFIDRFEEPENGGMTSIDGQTYVYLFIGKILPWDKTHAGFSDLSPPTPDGDVQGNSYEPWRDMLALERIVANTDISLGARRVDWETATVYTQYDDQNPAITKATTDFFVYDDAASNVFKCLDNNSGAASTIRPTKPIAPLLENSFVTSDGYRWKYMFTIPGGSVTKFLTNNYLPVLTVNSLASTPPGYDDQATVQANANNGTIEAYVIVAGGAGYTAHSGGITTTTTVVDSANSTFFQLAPDAVTTALPDDHFNGATIFISNTTHLEKGMSIISDYGTLGDATTYPRSVLLQDAFAEGFVTELGDTFVIGPSITISGDGTEANAYSTCSTAGSVIKVTTFDTGNSYSTANVTVVQPDNLAGSGASIRGIIPPQGGHGRDAVTELNGFNVIVTKELNGAGVGNTFPISNEYRVVGLVRNAFLADGYNEEVKNPATSGANWYANTTPLRQATWIRANTTDLMGSTSWTPTLDDEVVGKLSRAKARVVEYNTDGRGILNLTNIVSNTSGLSFMENEEIGLIQDADGVLGNENTQFVTGNTASVGFIVDPAEPTFYAPELQPYTGEILYIENRTPITRSADQLEDISIVIEF